MRVDLILRLNLWPWAFGAGRTGRTYWLDLGPLGFGVRMEDDANG